MSRHSPEVCLVASAFRTDDELGSSEEAVAKTRTAVDPFEATVAIPRGTHTMYSQRSLVSSRSLSSIAFAVCTLTLRHGQGQQQAPTTDDASIRKDVREGRRKFALSLYGAGDLLASPGTTTDASKARGQIGLQVLFPNDLFIALSFNATSFGGTLQSKQSEVFGASIVNTELGPYSFSGQAKWANVASVFGVYVSGRISAYKWVFADDGVAGVPPISAIPYAFGVGTFASWRPSSDSIGGNNLYIDAGFGFAVRGVGGDVSQRGRLLTYIGSNASNFAGPELSVGVEFNAIRAGASVLYFPTKDVDGVSGIRLVVNVGAAGDALRIAPK